MGHASLTFAFKTAICFYEPGVAMDHSVSLQDSQSRSRRVLQLPITRIIIAILFMVATVLLLQAFAAIFHFKPNGALSAMVAATLTNIALIGSYASYVHLVERRYPTELVSKHAAPNFVLGFLLGSLLFSLVMAVLWLAGVAAIGRGTGSTAVWIALSSASELGVLQAILVYGILFRIIEQGLGTLIAVLVTVFIFGALHAASPGAGVVSELIIGLEGVLFAAVYVYSRGLWMPIGLFTAWNFVESGVFGVSVPGHTEAGLLVSRFNGPVILTGGSAGPEVTVVAVLLCLTAAAWLFWRASKNGTFMRPHIAGSRSTSPRF
jgi:membrane protease YdiL (CAAX protease family)